MTYNNNAVSNVALLDEVFQKQIGRMEELKPMMKLSRF